jgi:hypothetical protein
MPRRFIVWPSKEIGVTSLTDPSNARPQGKKKKKNTTSAKTIKPKGQVVAITLSPKEGSGYHKIPTPYLKRLPSGVHVLSHSVNLFSRNDNLITGAYLKSYWGIFGLLNEDPDPFTFALKRGVVSRLIVYALTGNPDHFNLPVLRTSEGIWWYKDGKYDIALKRVKIDKSERCPTSFSYYSTEATYFTRDPKGPFVTIKIRLGLGGLLNHRMREQQIRAFLRIYGNIAQQDLPRSIEEGYFKERWKVLPPFTILLDTIK